MTFATCSLGRDTNNAPEWPPFILSGMYGPKKCTIRRLPQDAIQISKRLPRPFSSVFLLPHQLRNRHCFNSNSHNTAFVHDHRSNLFDSNIQPVRAILRSGNNSDNAKLGIFLWQHWRATKTAVVGEATSKVPNSLTTTTDRDDPIASILQFPPLLDAFDEFCRKALCIEVGGLSRIKSGHWLYPKTHGVLRNPTFKVQHNKGSL